MRQYQIKNGEWTTIIFEGTIGEKGAEYIGIEIDLAGSANNNGTFQFRNIAIEMTVPPLTQIINSINRYNRILGYINLNSNQIMVQDSITEYAASGEPLFKIMYEWDENHKQVVATAYYYDGNNKVPYTKTEYLCNANGDISSEVEYKWNANTNSWVGTYKPGYTWDNETNSWIIETTDYDEVTYDEVTYYENGKIKTARILAGSGNLPPSH